MHLTLSLSIPLALGNGTRPQGIGLATIEAPEGFDPADLFAAAFDAVDLDSLDWVPDGCDITWIDGLSLREICTALRSPHVRLTPASSARPTIAAQEPNCPPPDGSKKRAKDWRKTRVATMYFGPQTDAIREALSEAGLTTAGHIDREGNARKGLLHIAGIGQAEQAAIAETMRGLAPTNERRGTAVP